jgi:TM2 domain-containing membrane protein YozV
MQDKIYFIIVFLVIIIILCIDDYQIKHLQEEVNNISEYMEYLNSKTIQNEYYREED